MIMKAQHIKDAYFVPSDKLNELRKFLNGLRGLEHNFEGIMQFRVVVDTNVVLGDIRWLALKRKNNEARTSLLEIIQAGTAEVYVPQSLFSEVDKHIPRISKEEGVDQALLYAVWADYQENLKMIKLDDHVIQDYRNQIDPDDAPFIALAEAIQAVGVVSNDAHIKMMGGKKISIDFVIALRDYSRTAAIDLNIQCMGLQLGLVGIGAAIGVFEGIKALVSGIAKAPDWLKATLIFGVIFCVLHSGTRKKILDGVKRVLGNIQGVTPGLMSHIAEASALAREQGAMARSHLNQALKELEN